MKAVRSTIPKKVFHLATGLALGATLLAFSTSTSKAEDFLFGDTGEQTDYQLKSGQYPYYGKTIITRKHYRYRRAPYRYRYPRRVRYYDPFFSPFYHRGFRHHYTRYHSPFADPFFGGYGYHGHGIAFRFR